MENTVECVKARRGKRAKEGKVSHWANSKKVFRRQHIVFRTFVACIIIFRVVLDGVDFCCAKHVSTLLANLASNKEFCHLIFNCSKTYVLRHPRSFAKLSHKYSFDSSLEGKHDLIGYKTVCVNIIKGWNILARFWKMTCPKL